MFLLFKIITIITHRVKIVNKKLTKKRNKALDINKKANYNKHHIILTNMLINKKKIILKERQVKNMVHSLFMTAQEVADILNISKPYAYKIINRLNKELEEKNFIIIPGKVSRKYFEEKFYGIKINERGD